jgi:hypothetical protein
MEWWMYAVVIGMFLFATIATVWLTLWTIKRGYARRPTTPVDRVDQPE